VRTIILPHHGRSRRLRVHAPLSDWQAAISHPCRRAKTKPIKANGAKLPGSGTAAAPFAVANSLSMAKSDPLHGIVTPLID
jgi:hypothetical protein